MYPRVEHTQIQCSKLEHINLKLAKTQGKLGRCGRMKCFHGSNNAMRIAED